ncbi:MAG TPA: ATP-dependent DNA helicase [Clostridiaceae bacterium]|nr:ATP-dependent DNA helicase [Clostridiaceae bacterium]
MKNTIASNQITISARRLAETIHRSGGLAVPVYGGIDSLDGIKIHQKFSAYLNSSSNEKPKNDDPAIIYQKNNTMKFDIVCSELSLSGNYIASEIHLKIKGRLDNLTIKNNKIILYEIKSFRGNSDFLPEHGDPVHWAQLKIYAYLLKYIKKNDYPENIKNKFPNLSEALDNSLKSDVITLKLIYISVDSDEIVEKVKILTWDELSEFMIATCEEYIFRMKNIFLWQDMRNESIKNSGFPFDSIRDGQTKMMRQTLATIRDNASILVQAPTGIGKTMAALYPAIKALSAKYINRVFYATAMIATRDIALQSLKILRNCGFMIRSILLQAKEKICTQPDLFCEQTICPFAVDYYQRLPDAINDLLPLQDILPHNITETALKHQICPHELSLDFADYCDVIIGDYNHIFDPQAKIQRFFEINDSDNKTAILIDEAHNLPSRARIMYSAGIKGEDLIKVCNILKRPQLNFTIQYGLLINTLEIMINELQNFSEIFRSSKKPEFNNFFSEQLNTQWLIDRNFIGVRQLPDLLITKIGRLIYLIRDFLDRQKFFEDRQVILDFWFDLIFFVKVAEFYFNEAYITAFRPSNIGFADSYLLALDTAEHLTNCYLNKHPTIFFSATLSPINYYHALLNNKLRDQPAEMLILDSPFPCENRLIAALTEYSVRLKDREKSMPLIAKLIFNACQKHIGNYLIFVPSYQYLFQIKNVIAKTILSNNDVDIIFQTRNMSELQKRAFLKKFEIFGTKSLLAFAVLGSHFNEGIDLQGEQLSGVFVIGTGMPQVSPEREIMTQYYAGKFEGGRAYGYQYPGFNRVQQAVGRLIRSENDIGFAVLIDDRYSSPEWQTVFPDDWLVKQFDEHQDLLSEIENFWQDHS